jgi:uncharacterized glyoxalase superfamily protein PhnB
MNIFISGMPRQQHGSQSCRHLRSAPEQEVLIVVDARYERAQAALAEIVKPPEDLPYGRSYTARDPEGHPWFFTTPPAER